MKQTLNDDKRRKVAKTLITDDFGSQLLLREEKQL